MQNDMKVTAVTTWLVIGSSLSAPQFIDSIAPLVGPAWRVITTNSGWQMLMVTDTPNLAPWMPDYYYLSDPLAIQIHARAARYMQQRGTTIVAKRSAADGLGIDLQDPSIDRIPLADVREQGPWTKGSYINGRCSGAICLQYAINNGARRVILVGMDGYQSTGEQIVRDTFDGRMGKSSGQQITAKWYGPLMQSIVAATPEVEYLVCGRPTYPLAGANVTIIPKPNSIAFNTSFQELRNGR